MTVPKHICQHKRWSWFRPLQRGTPALFCLDCGKWSWQIRNRTALTEAAKLYRVLTRPKAG